MLAYFWHMFPTISDLTYYFFGIHLSFPLQTLGVFMALAFLLAFVVFKEEFKRKEALGLIHSFKRKVTIGEGPSKPELIINSVLGFLFGFKVIGAFLDYSMFKADPKAFILSLNGSVAAGLVFGMAWFIWAYTAGKKTELPQPKVVEETVHPYQLMVWITFWAGFWGFMGAKLFDTVEHIGYFLANPLGDLFSSNGFTYYGGFIFGALSFLYIGHKHGMKLIHLADIGSPGMMLAYGVGRMGCQLSGDGDWGIVNANAKPAWLNWAPDWMWSFNFPHNIVNAGVFINGCTGNFCTVLARGVYPTSFYESVICILLFGFLWLIRKRIKIPGLMFCLYLLLNGCERFLIEFIRVTIKYNTLGFFLSQAQIIGALMMIAGVAGIGVIVYKRRHRNIFTR
jgi:phosphatidylglycerol:prolipoprotein diacylglycerol transferase